jgi:hypothetical protein
LPKRIKKDPFLDQISYTYVEDKSDWSETEWIKTIITYKRENGNKYLKKNVIKLKHFMSKDLKQSK